MKTQFQILVTVENSKLGLTRKESTLEAVHAFQTWARIKNQHGSELNGNVFTFSTFVDSKEIDSKE